MRPVRAGQIASTRTGRTFARANAKGPHASRWLLVALFGVLAAVVLAAHWRILSAQAMSFDDPDYLVSNPLVHSPGMKSVVRFFGEITRPTQPGMYQPLTMVSLMVDYALGGRPEDLRAFHRTSIALHAINTLLLALLLYRLFASVWAAVGAAAIFGVHPLTVEPVAWVAERGTLLAAGLTFLAMHLHLLWVRRSSRAAWAACIVAYALALMSKPTALPLPVLLLLLDYWPLRRGKGTGVFSLRLGEGMATGERLPLGKGASTLRTKRLPSPLLVEKIPLFAVGALFAIVTYMSRTGTKPVNWPTAADPLRVPLIVCHNVVFYLWKIVWPFNLAGHYPKPVSIHLSDGMFLAGVIGTIAIAVFVAVSLRSTKAILVGVAVYVVALLPTIQFLGFSITIASEKYAYLPFLGPMLIVAWALASIADDGGKRWVRAVRLAVPAGLAAVVLACIFASRSYADRWRDTYTLYRSMADHALDAFLPRLNLAVALEKRGDYDAAISFYREAYRLRPDNPDILLGLGGALVNRNYPDEAVPYLREAVRLKPDSADGHYNLGTALLGLKKYEQAEQHLARAVALAPTHADAYGNLGSALAGLDRREEAVAAFKKALELRPDLVAVRFNLAGLLARKGDTAGAAEQLGLILRTEPDSVDALCRLAWLRSAGHEASAHDPAEAVRLAERAAALTRHADPKVLDVLAVAYASAGRFPDAAVTAGKALALAGSNADPGLAQTIRNRLELFRAGQPYREEPPR